MFFDELSNEEWALLSALVSDEPAVRLNRRGRPRAEPRTVTNAVLWILTTGEPWSRLPGRYPSGPTCRRRFEEWQLNGTLAAMVRLLSQTTGRRFVYVPEPSAPVSIPAAPIEEKAAVRDDGLRGVFWKSPESWQAPQGVANDSRPVDPFAEITRQLTCSLDDAPVRAQAQASAHSAAAPGREQPLQLMQPQDDSARCPLTIGLSACGTPYADRRGYAIYVVAQSAPQGMYRAWAEIMKDGRRVERSGLVGPRFEHPEAAEQYALDWAQKWIARQDLTLADARHRGVDVLAGPPAPVSRSMPAPRPAPVSTTSPTSHPASSPATAVSATARKPIVAGPSVGPVAQHVNESAGRVPLRRYPFDGIADTSADGSPMLPELISHH